MRVQIKSKVPEFHEVIDRAVASRATQIRRHALAQSFVDSNMQNTVQSTGASYQLSSDIVW